jgi:hypothetical protein
MFSDVPITCTAEVSSEAASLEELLLHAKAARKDPAVHVSLSSYSLFKQPGTEAVPAPGGPGAVEAPRIREPSDAGSLFQ